MEQRKLKNLDTGRRTDAAHGYTSPVLRVELGRETRLEPGPDISVGAALARTMFDESPIGTAIMDPSGRYLSTNASLDALLGFEPNELVGRYLWEQCPNESSAAAISHMRRLFDGTVRSSRWEQRYRRPDGREISVQLTAALLQGASGAVQSWLCMMEDITDRKQLEARLRQAQKMEAVGRFAGGIAHDFNNTLSAISAYAQILFDDLREDDERRLDAAEILKAASRAAGLTRQLLTFSRNRTLDYELLDICTIVEEFAALLRPLLPASIELTTHVPQGAVTIQADRTQFEQVLMNLALNARDAMPSGGQLKIELTRRGASDASANHRDAQCGFAVLTVTDTGAGMSAEVRARLFEPFFTTKAEGHGTGLGLATVYAIVRQAGGTVIADSRPGEGSRFSVTLPVASGPAPAGCPATAATPSAERQSRVTVLLTEDEQSVREAARRLLQRAGMRVLTARDGKEALDIISTDEQIDVLMTDVMMPVMGGMELIERAAVLRPGMRIIVISGHADIGEPEAALGGDMTLRKPFSADSLIHAVRSVTARQT